MGRWQQTLYTQRHWNETTASRYVFSVVLPTLRRQDSLDRRCAPLIRSRSPGVRATVIDNYLGHRRRLTPCTSVRASICMRAGQDKQDWSWAGTDKDHYYG